MSGRRDPPEPGGVERGPSDESEPVRVGWLWRLSVHGAFLVTAVLFVLVWGGFCDGVDPFGRAGP